nr:Uncharacterised protein [Klebsiella pneumoniae]
MSNPMERYTTQLHDRRRGMAVINAIKDYNASLPLVVLAGSPLAQLAREQGCRLWLKPLPTGPTIRTVR